MFLAILVVALGSLSFAASSTIPKNLDEMVPLKDMVMLDALDDMNALDVKDEMGLDFMEAKIDDDEDYDIVLAGSGDSEDEDEFNDLVDELVEERENEDEDDFNELVDELVEEIIETEDQPFDENTVEDDDYNFEQIERQYLKQDGSGGFSKSDLVTAILTALASFIIASLFAILYVAYRTRKMKKELCQEAELCGFLDDSTYHDAFSSKVIWKGERKNKQNQWL